MGKRPSVAECGLVFYVEKALGSANLARALRDLGARVEEHGAHFKRTTEPEVSDAYWIRYTGERGWIALTKDFHSLSKRLALDEIESSCAHVFSLRTTTKLTGPQEVATVLLRLPNIIQIALREGPHTPYLARFYGPNHSNPAYVWKRFPPKKPHTEDASPRPAE